MTDIKTDKKKLIDHISRLEGQLGAVKKQLQSEEPDCVKSSASLCAASRSFASLRRNFLSCFLKEKGISHEVAKEDKDTYQALMRIVSS